MMKRARVLESKNSKLQKFNHRPREEEGDAVEDSFPGKGVEKRNMVGVGVRVSPLPPNFVLFPIQKLHSYGNYGAGSQKLVLASTPVTKER